MAYQKQDWNKNIWLLGQENLQNMLNHIEQGIFEAGVPGGSLLFKDIQGDPMENENLKTILNSKLEKTEGGGIQPTTVTVPNFDSIVSGTATSILGKNAQITLQQALNNKENKLPDYVANKYLKVNSEGTGLLWADAGGGPGGTTDFNDLTNRPKYNGTIMSGSTNIPEVKTTIWDAKQDALPTATANKYLKANSSGGLEWADTPITDVKINTTSIVSDGVATIPHAATNIYGVVKLKDEGTDGNGLYINNGNLSVLRASAAGLNNKNSDTVVTCINLVKAVKAAVGISVSDTDTTNSWTAAEKQTASKTLLPAIVNDRYLHTNASTGDLEWVAGGGGGSYTAGYGIDINSGIISIKGMSNPMSTNAVLRTKDSAGNTEWVGFNGENITVDSTSTERVSTALNNRLRLDTADDLPWYTMPIVYYGSSGNSSGNDAWPIQTWAPYLMLLPLDFDPTSPTTPKTVANGTYVAKAVKTSSGITYSWVKES